MKRIAFTLAILLFAAVSSAVYAENNSAVTLSNKQLSRTFTVSQGVLRTTEISNKRANTTWTVPAAAEFKIRVSQGTELVEGDEYLTSADFVCTNQKSYALENAAGQGVEFTLNNKQRQITVVVRYELKESDFYMRKWLEIESQKPITLEYIEVESIPAADAYQPYTTRHIHARGSWRPGLGQPLYTTQTGTFWGIEFPAAVNTVENGVLQCAYYWGRQITPGQKYKTYAAVCGAGDDPAFIFDSFLEYIDLTRAHAARLQVQYNTWFDYGPSVSQELFSKSVETINDELVEKRGCKPLNAYVIDDGWSRKTDIVKQAYPVNEKFDSDFASSLKTVRDAHSTLGLWLSPGCFFGSRSMVHIYREMGFEALSLSMSMCGPKYMDLWEKRVIELTQQGVCYFKFDGLFGHLNLRDFELNGRGCPAMPQLDTKFSCNDQRLNDDIYNELKYYYLTAGTERLIPAFAKMRAINPDVYIAITNGAWLSPWWLQHADVVWMINAGDAAGGASRTEELVYRDGVYFSICRTDKTQFPLNSIFNHEPKKNRPGEAEKDFRDYLFMNQSRGSGFVELYIRPKVLTPGDWDVLAEALKWTREIFPCFKRARLHGGAPGKRDVYGFSGWDGKSMGYISVHNPSDKAKEYTVTLNRALGMIPNDTNVYDTKEIVGKNQGDLAPQYKSGDSITFKLEPKEIRVIQFNRAEK